MSEPVLSPPERDAARSRAAILDAAEQLFATRGYKEASLEAIGRLAGVSRGTPRYFFGAKEQLYRAVLTRILTSESQVLMEAQSRALAAGGDLEAVLKALVDALLDFLVARPTFVQLIEREAAGGGEGLQAVARETPEVQAGLAALAEYFAGVMAPTQSPVSILLSLLALCWFPLAHANTFTRGLGLDPESPAFLGMWKRHIVTLVLCGIERE